MRQISPPGLVPATSLYLESDQEESPYERDSAPCLPTALQWGVVRESHPFAPGSHPGGALRCLTTQHWDTGSNREVLGSEPSEESLSSLPVCCVTHRNGAPLTRCMSRSREPENRTPNHPPPRQACYQRTRSRGADRDVSRPHVSVEVHTLVSCLTVTA
jgi:hypothetical protein